MRFKRVSILGVGLLGGSVGLAIRSATTDCRIVGYGHRRQTLEKARHLGAIDVAHDDPAAAVADADLVILCTPVGIFPSLLEKIIPSLKPGTIVTDVGSTKAGIVELAGQLLPANVHFVGSHPIAGSEKRGVEFASAELFRNALCLLTPTPATHPPALEEVDQFWQFLGMRTRRLSPERHDELLAQISHLPHALAALLVVAPDAEALEVCGKGFLDTTRIAAGDAALWRDIFVDNSRNIVDAIGKLQNELDRFKRLLMEKAGPEIQDWLDAAARRREAITQAKLRELSGE